MADRYLRQSALASEALESRRAKARGDAGVALDERSLPTIVNLRGNTRDKAFMAAVEKELGVSLPTKSNTVHHGKGCAILWLGPDEWWVIVHTNSNGEEHRLGEALRAALSETRSAVTEVGESRVCILVSGARTRELLAKGCSVDLHQDVFGGPGCCAQTNLAKAMVLLHQSAEDETNGPVFEIYVLRSFASYLWRWLEDAAREYGCVVHSA